MSISRTFRAGVAALAAFAGGSVPVEAIYPPEAGALWATNANRLGATGTNVPVAFVEVDTDGVPGSPYKYRINPDPTDGWENGRYENPELFKGKTITYYDDGNPENTNYSSHATGIARAGIGNYYSGSLLSRRGIAIGCTNVPNIEANHFVDTYLASNLAPPGQCFSFAFTTQTTDQERLSTGMDQLVDNHSKIFVQGVRPLGGHIS